MKEFKRFENNAALMNVLTRRSVRAFKQEQITDEELDAILTAAVYAPTAMNRQTSKFTVLQGEKLEKLVSAITAAVLYAALNLINIDAMIAQSVLKKADARGYMTELDTRYLAHELSSDADGVIAKSERWREQVYRAGE